MERNKIERERVEDIYLESQIKKFNNGSESLFASPSESFTNFSLFEIRNKKVKVVSETQTSQRSYYQLT